jgi:hypothetical integral membrane protein (TIGR02206 family)
MHSFESFSWMHGLPILVISGFCYGVIRYSRNKSEKIKIRNGFLLALLTLACTVIRSMMLLYHGTYSIKTDLPLHLCGLLTIAMPFLMYYKNAKWLSICYFLIFAGTLQAVITPDLNAGYGHLTYYTYFIVHTVLVWMPIYVFQVHRIKPTFKHLISSVIVANIYLILVHCINLLLGSNYFYTVHKPRSGSLLDYFGEWPIYLLVGEVVAIILFILLYLPFYYGKKRS